MPSFHRTTTLPPTMPDTASSPCVNTCRIDPDSGLCAGCLRTLDEIANWGRFSDEERRAVNRALDARRRDAPQSGSAN